MIRLKDLIPGERQLNFDLQNYNTEEILKCSKIPIGEGACRWIKELTVEEFLRKNNIEIVKSDDVVGVVPFGAENQRVANSEGFVYSEYDDLLPDGFFENGIPWNNDDQWQYSETLMNEPTCSRLIKIILLVEIRYCLDVCIFL